MHELTINVTSNYDAVISVNVTSLPVQAFNNVMSHVVMENQGVALLWLPYVLMTVVILALLCVSFVRFHMQNKERYIRREVIARQESGSLSLYSGKITPVEEAPFDPDAVHIFRPDDTSDTRQESPQFGDGPNADSVSIGSCTSIMEPNGICRTKQGHTKVKRTKNIMQTKHGAVKRSDDIELGLCTDRVSTPDERSGSSIVEQMDECVIKDALERHSKPKINCRQSLTFTKRDSRISLYEASGRYHIQ